MNPLVISLLQRFVQLGLAAIFGYFVTKGWFTDPEAKEFIAGGSALIVALLLSYFQTLWSRRKMLTAAATPRVVSEHEVEKMVSAGQAPPVTLPKTRVPYLPGQKPEAGYDGPDERIVTK